MIRRYFNTGSGKLETLKFFLSSRDRTHTNMDINQIIRFYFITDENAPDLSMRRQTEIAVRAGATAVQYRNKTFSPENFTELVAIRELCARHGVPMIVNDDIILAKAVDADGVHLGQEDANARIARQIMGPDAIIGISVSTLEEMAKTDLQVCDYIGTGPVFATSTKPDAHPVIGLNGLAAVADASLKPVVAIGGIDASRAASCFSRGAAGVSVITCISRAPDPLEQALKLADACGCPPRTLKFAWDSEFGLIEKLTATPVEPKNLTASVLKVGPGDDAALLKTIARPVVTTDTQHENVHFRRGWQAWDQIGEKAVAVTFSDLAAAYARPVVLFVNLSIPSYMADADMEAVYAGIRRGLETYAAVLGGGNISASREFSLDLFALGDGHPEIFPLRSNARPGWGLYVTGPLGLARAGLACLKKKDLSYPALIEKFIRPVARFDAAEILANHKVTCVMDISDGLAGDAGHMARASHVTIKFDFSAWYMDPAFGEFCGKYQKNPEIMMLAGGEDYELLFACPSEIFEQIKKEWPLACQVGVCEPFSGRFLENCPEAALPFQHGFRNDKDNKGEQT